MITPEPPAGSEHYREGWRHGYEQAAIDRERSDDAVRLVPEHTDGPSDALVLAAAAGRLRAMSEHHREEFSHILSGIARWMEMVLYVEDSADERARALRSARALLGTDTPDPR